MDFVKLTYEGKEFEVATTTVTAEEYKTFCKETGKPEYDKTVGREPAVYVNYYDAVEFCEWMSKKDPEYSYRLPTEEEWEFAARGGSTGDYCFGNDVSKLDDYAWYYNNSGGKVHEVGLKLPNNFGLYDVHGNVYEWTSSIYEDD